MFPDDWVKRPSTNIDESASVASDELLKATLQVGGCTVIQYTFPWPKWQFLCFIVEQYHIVGLANKDST